MLKQFKQQFLHVAASVKKWVQPYPFLKNAGHITSSAQYQQLINLYQFIPPVSLIMIIKCQDLSVIHNKASDRRIQSLKQIGLNHVFNSQTSIISMQFGAGHTGCVSLKFALASIHQTAQARSAQSETLLFANVVKPVFMQASSYHTFISYFGTVPGN